MIVYAPRESEDVENCWAVASLCIVILALGITAPEGSVTVPEIDDVMFCASAGFWIKQRIRTMKNIEADVKKFMELLREMCD